MTPALLINKITHGRTDSFIELYHMSEVDKRARVRITLTSEENFLDIYFLFRKAMEYLSSQRYQHLTGFFEEHSEVVMPNGDVIPLTEYKLT